MLKWEKLRPADQCYGVLLRYSGLSKLSRVGKNGIHLKSSKPLHSNNGEKFDVSPLMNDSLLSYYILWSDGAQT